MGSERTRPEATGLGGRTCAGLASALFATLLLPACMPSDAEDEAAEA